MLDGALGTELEERGLPLVVPLWSADALRSSPELVEAIHLDYLIAGADVLTANTFRTNPRAFLSAGRTAAEAEAASHTAVALARRAVERYSAHDASPRRPIWIAGSISPVEDCYQPDRVPESELLVQEHRAHADTLRKTGVDVLLVETMNTVREAAIATAAGHATGLPVWVSFVCREAGRIYSGEPIAAGVEAVRRAGASAVGINCAPADVVGHALRDLRRLTSLPILAYANGGRVESDGLWRRDDDLDAARYATLAADWLDSGAAVVGGCCGTRPSHISALRAVVDTRATRG